MVDQKVPGNAGIRLSVLIHKLILYKFIQAVFKIPQKNLAAFAGEQFEDIIFVFLQMLQ